MGDCEYLKSDSTLIPISYKLCKIVGPVLLDAFNKQLLAIEKFHVLGHSLGGQCAGILGQSVIQGGKKLKR